MKTRLQVLCLVVLLCAFAPLLSEARSTCSTIDLRASLGPPRDQGNTGWCYAFTAADLISQKLRTRVSAFDIATGFSFNDRSSISPNDRRFKEFVRKNPGALKRWDEAVGSQIKQLTDEQVACLNTGVYQFGGIDEVAILLSNLNGLCREESLPRTQSEIESASEEIKLFAATVNLDDLYCRAPGELPPLQTYRPPFDEPQASSFFRAVVNHWTGSRCSPRLRPRATLMPGSLYLTDETAVLLRKYRDHKRRAVAQKVLYSAIDRALERGAAVSIGYSLHDLLAGGAEVLEKFENRQPMKFRVINPKLRHGSATPSCPESTDGVEEAESDILGDHASIVAARKMIGGECHYFVRNSFGEDCNDFRPELTHRCEVKNGGIWVRKSELSTLYGVVWIE